jgi:hypothetical protein
MSEQLIGEKDSGDLAMRSDSASARRAMRTHGKQNVTRGHKSSGGGSRVVWRVRVIGTMVIETIHFRGTATTPCTCLRASWVKLPKWKGAKTQ